MYGRNKVVVSFLSFSDPLHLLFLLCFICSRSSIQRILTFMSKMFWEKSLTTHWFNITGKGVLKSPDYEWSNCNSYRQIVRIKKTVSKRNCLECLIEKSLCSLSLAANMPYYFGKTDLSVSTDYNYNIITINWQTLFFSLDLITTFTQVLETLVTNDSSIQNYPRHYNNIRWTSDAYTLWFKLVA